jgi:HemY protein
MIRVTISIIAMTVAMATGHLLIDEKGYVLIAYNDVTIEATIVAMAIMCCLLTIGIWVAVKIVKLFWCFYRKSTGHFGQKRAMKASQAWQQALWASVNDDNEQVKLAFKRHDAPNQWQDYQFALLAKSALQQGDQATALQHLTAMSEDAQSKVPKLWLQADKGEQALSLLETPMQQKKPKPTQVETYLESLLLEQKYDELFKTLNDKHKQVTWSAQYWQSFFKRLFTQIQAQTEEYYQQLPKVLKGYAEQTYLESMAAKGQIKQVRSVLLKWLKKGLYREVAAVISVANEGDLQLTQAIQIRLKKQPDHPDLLVCLACMANVDGDFELAAKIFDNINKSDWYTGWTNMALYSYEQTRQYQKAYELAMLK